MFAICDTLTFIIEKSFYESILKIKENEFKVIIIIFDDNISYEHIKLLKLYTKYKMIVIMDTTNVQELKLYELGISCVLENGISNEILNYRIKKYINDYDTIRERIIEDDENDILVDRITKTVHRNGKLIKLTDTEYKLLVLLLTNIDNVMSRKEIEKSVLGNNISYFDYE